MSKEIKSRMFKFGFPEGDQLDAFKNDIFILKEFDASYVERVINHIKKIIKADTKKETYSLYDEIVESKLVESHSIIYSFHRIAKYFFEKLSEEDSKKDKPEIIVEDIANKLNLEENQLSTIEILLITIKKEVEWYKLEELKEEFEIGLFPNLKGIGTTVELRGVFSREIKFKEKIENYSKEVEINEESPIIPTISVALTLDSGSPKRFCFQVSPENTEWLIEELKAALHKSNMLKEKFNI